MLINEDELKDFLAEAKKQGYAGYGKETPPSRPMSRDIPHQRGDYAYLDSYLGELNFIGEEVVWHGGEPVWGMNYYGEMLTDSVPGEFDHCLKGALRSCPREAPFRGPNRFSWEDLEYECAWEGDLASFSGEEAVFHQGIKIYKLKFHGGYLKFTAFSR